jgi:hypothetical protein
MGKQSQPLRIESPEWSSFITIRTINSALWFVNCNQLTRRILAFLAKYAEKYKVTLYAKAFSGSHLHLLARFPLANRAQFCRDMNARTAEAVRMYQERFPGGPVFERRYSEQAVPLPEDIEDRFFYCALQPVSAGLCERISDYPEYNSFSHAANGDEETYELVNYTEYRKAKRRDPSAQIKDFTESYTLKFARLPGYEELSQEDYKKMLLQKLEERRSRIVNQKRAEGHTFLTKDELRKTVPGTLAKSPKKSTRNSPRPIVLTKCLEAKQRFLSWYFGIYDRYKIAVQAYLAGAISTVFPPGTYRPPGLMSPLALAP